ncbi:MAG: GNAT family N-acetyltransferase [Alphaproteobacteria bacterium]|nr:GNAT family N-acetyltransferase [Alphaproteobacteria bacterium]
MIELKIEQLGTCTVEGFPSFPYTCLTTERLIIRAPNISHQKDWVDVRTQNKDRLQPYEPLWSENWSTAEGYRARLAYQNKEWREDRGYFFLLFRRDDQSLIGGMNVNNVIRGSAQFASLGYWIDEAHEGQGFMSEAMDSTLAFCFDILKLQRVHAAILPDNTRSQKLLERFHFIKEGMSPKFAEINGTREDHDLYGVNFPEDRS